MAGHQDASGRGITRNNKQRKKKMAAAPPPVRRQTVIVAVSVVLVVAAGLRMLGLTSDLWLDEVWSLQVATDRQSIWEVFSLHHEINHHLNTMWLYLLGPHASPAAYHLLSLLAGIGSVAVAGLIGFRRSTAAGVIAMVLIGTSYPLVLFSSEARGYAVLVLCALLSYYALDTYLDAPGWRKLVLYNTVAVLGLFSQPVFAAVLAAACAWSAYGLARSGRPPAAAATAFVLCQGVPLLCFAVLYAVDLQHIRVGGGTATQSILGAYAVSLAWAMGTPQSTGAMVVAGGIAVALLVGGLRHLMATRSDHWVFFAGAIVVFPLLLIVVRGSDFIYTRHFLVGMAFLLVLLSGLLGSWWIAGGRRRTAAAVFVLVFVAANGAHIVTFAERGRGHYRDAIRYIVDASAGPFVTVGAYHDFRVGTQVRHDASAASPKVVQFLDRASWPPDGPAWLIVQTESVEPLTPPPTLEGAPGRQFVLQRTVRTAPLTGLNWFIYRNQPLRVDESVAASISARSREASTVGTRRHRRTRTSAGSGRRRSGRSSATGSPSRVTVNASPFTTRASTSAPEFRNSRIVTSAMRQVYRR